MSVRSSIPPLVDGSEVKRSSLLPVQRAIYDFIFSKLPELKINPLYLFVSGPAGTGKSILLAAVKNMIDTILGSKASLVTAPVGVAAANVKATTIHSTFLISWNRVGHFDDVPPTKLKKLRELLEGVKALILDEISMVDAVLLAELDYMLQVALQSPLPFGGLSLIVFGDLLQLPPFGGFKVFEELPSNIATIREKKLPHATKKLWSLMQIKELTENIRTRNSTEAEVLESIRLGNTDARLINKLQSCCPLLRCTGTFVRTPEGIFNKLSELEAAHPTKTFAILAPTKIEVKALNEWKIAKTGPVFTIHPLNFTSTAKAAEFFYEGVKETIRTAIGSKMMITHNLDTQAGLVNGTIGWLVQLDANSITLRVPKIGTVALCRIKYRDLEMRNFWEQFPVQTAEASTIHRVQGMTFDGVVISTHRIFGDGAIYTALSRARSLALCRITRFNVESWNTSKAARREYERMRSSKPAENGGPQSITGAAIQILQAELAASEETVRKLAEENSTLSQHKRARQSAWECSICYEEYNDITVVPRVLFCGHTYCQRCMENCVQLSGAGHRFIRCGQCRQGARLEDYSIANLFVKNYDIIPADGPVPQ